MLEFKRDKKRRNCATDLYCLSAFFLPNTFSSLQWQTIGNSLGLPLLLQINTSIFYTADNQDNTKHFQANAKQTQV